MSLHLEILNPAGKRWLALLAMLAFAALFVWLAVINYTLRENLPRLRLEAGKAQDMARTISELQSRPQKKWTNDSLATVLNALAKQQNLSLYSESTNLGVKTKGKALSPESISQWLLNAQREVQLAPSAASFDVQAGEGATLLDIQIEWQVAEESAR